VHYPLGEMNRLPAKPKKLTSAHPCLDGENEKHVLDLIGDGNRFPAFAKPASAGKVRSEKIMREQNITLR
jgi:hypothetical protein